MDSSLGVVGSRHIGGIAGIGGIVVAAVVVACLLILRGCCGQVAGELVKVVAPFVKVVGVKVLVVFGLVKNHHRGISRWYGTPHKQLCPGQDVPFFRKSKKSGSSCKSRFHRFLEFDAG